MDKNTRVAIVAIAAGVVSVADYLRLRRTHRLIRANIELKTEQEIAAVWAAAATVQEKINLGHYNGKGIDALRRDLDFYKMTHFLQDEN